MILNIDSLIFIGFLAINLVVGLFYGRGIKTIKEYAIGNRNFSTSTIAATILATWIGAGVFSMNITGSYKDGLYYIIPALGNGLMFIIIGYFLSVRMAEFLGSLSIAEVMGNLYGKHVRLITSLMSIFFCMGTVAIQFKVSSNILQLFFDIPSFYSVIIAAIIIITYSAWGGIKSVTFTDLIQIFMFGSIIPIISIIIWGTLTNPTQVFEHLSYDPLFSLSNVFNYHDPKFFSCLLLFFVFLFPELDPAVFQRILIAKNTVQISRSFILAGFICLGILSMLFWIGTLLRANNPNLDPSTLLNHIIANYAYVGLKGVIGSGIMAAIMSTADSYINSSAVIFAHDVCQPLKRKWIDEKQLFISRIFSVFIGVFCFFLAFQRGILDLMTLTWSFYMPIVSVPLILAILGFRTTSKSVLISMASGFLTVVLWRIYLLDIVDSVAPGILANLVALLGSHYLLRQPGGWVGIKNKKPLLQMRRERKLWVNNLISTICNFNFLTFCKNNAPKQESTYPLFGLFCIVSVFSTMYSMPKEVHQQHHQIIELIYHTVLVSSSVFLTYPIWPPTFKKEKFIIVAWTASVPYILLFAPILLILISNFGQFQLMILMLNIIIMATLLRWQVAIFMIFVSIFASIKFFTWFTGIDNLALNFGSLQFKIMYSLLLVSSVLIAFLKPKQEYQQLTEAKVDHLGNQITDREKELEKSLELKYEFLRNLEHEARTPITGITTMGQILAESYDKFTEAQRRKAIGDIARSSERLTTLVNNLIDLSKLSNMTYELNKKPVNLSNMVYNSIEACVKMYLNGKELEFVTNIEDNVTISCDEYYIKQTLDNLIINAISYSKEGTITVNLKRNADSVEFSIQDEGIGIPTNELRNIFGAFTVSSKTRTPAGGRGVGLALCEKVIKLHGGEIKAESNGVKGAIFKFIV